MEIGISILIVNLVLKPKTKNKNYIDTIHYYLLEYIYLYKI